jgi:hypothetical protein
MLLFNGAISNLHHGEDGSMIPTWMTMSYSTEIRIGWCSLCATKKEYSHLPKDFFMDSKSYGHFIKFRVFRKYVSIICLGNIPNV